MIYGGIGGGTAERTYCHAAISIRDGSTKTVDEVRKQLATILPFDAQFRQSFLAARVTRSTLARYILLALEKSACSEPEPELVPNEDASQVNLEHVLPKNARANEWPRFTDDQRRSDVTRIGNMALLRKTTNTRIGNKAFAEKRSAFTNSGLELTAEIGHERSWSSTTIDKRQRRLADLALLTWTH